MPVSKDIADKILGGPFMGDPVDPEAGKVLLNTLLGFAALPAQGLTQIANLLPGAQLPQEDVQKLWDPSALTGPVDQSQVEGLTYPFQKIEQGSNWVGNAIAGNTGYTTPMEGPGFGSSEYSGRDTASEMMGAAAKTATQLLGYGALGELMGAPVRGAENIMGRVDAVEGAARRAYANSEMGLAEEIARLRNLDTKESRQRANALETDLLNKIDQSAQPQQPKTKFERIVEEFFPIGNTIKIVDIKDLTPEILNRMNRTLKKEGYDVRGSKDVAELIAKNQGKLFDDWAKAYESAVSGVAKRINKKESIKEMTPNVDWNRVRSLGTTPFYEEAGYIRDNGSLVDLSGKREGGLPYRRSLDHREIGGFSGMQEFINAGNIRMDYNSGSFQIFKKPTKQQYNELGKILRNITKEDDWRVFLDLDTGLGEFIESTHAYEVTPKRTSLEYQVGTNPSKIINDIKEFYSKND